MNDVDFLACIMESKDLQVTLYLRRDDPSRFYRGTRPAGGLDDLEMPTGELDDDDEFLTGMLMGFRREDGFAAECLWDEGDLNLLSKPDGADKFAIENFLIFAGDVVDSADIAGLTEPVGERGLKYTIGWHELCRQVASKIHYTEGSKQDRKMQEFYNL